jgi:hypothetical protein
MGAVTFTRDAVGNLSDVLAVSALNDNWIKFNGQSDAVKATIELDNGTTQKEFIISPNADAEFYFNVKEAVKSFFTLAVDDFAYTANENNPSDLVQEIDFNVTVEHSVSANDTGTVSAKFIKAKKEIPNSIFIDTETRLTPKAIYFTGYPFELSVIKANGDFIRYFKNTIQLNLIESLKLITNFLGLYVVDDDQYSEGVWIDNGTAEMDTVLVDGSAPIEIENWKSQKGALQFNGSTSLRIAETADNYNIHNTANSVFVIGQYDESTIGNVETFIDTNTQFQIEKYNSEDVAQFKVITTTKIPYSHGIDHNGVPSFIIAHISDGKSFGYVNGDFYRIGSFTSRSFGDSFIGGAGGAFTGKIAAVGVTDGEASNIELKGIIKRSIANYDLEDLSDNFLVFIGDSLMAGATITTLSERLTNLLMDDLETTYSEIFRYSNDAVSGIRVANYDADVFVDHFAFSNNYTINKRVAIIWLGSNDFAPFGVDPVDGETMLTNMIDFITKRLKAGFKKLIVCTVIERIEFQDDTDLGDEVDDYNAALVAYDFSTLETAYGADIQVCPLHDNANLQDPTDTTYFDVDEVHLNANGAAVVKGLIKPYYVTARGVTVASDTTNPIIESFSVPNNNSYIDIVFSKGVFADNEALTIVEASNFSIENFSASGSTAISISSIEAIDTDDIVGCDKSIRLNLNLTGTPDGAETFNIGATGVYDVFGNAIVADSAEVTLNGLDAATQALLTEAASEGDTAASGTSLNELDIAIKALKSTGVWAKSDAIFCFASNGDQAFNLYDIKNPATRKGTANNTPTFTSLEGFTGSSGSPVKHIDLDFDLGSDGINYDLNDASIIVYQRINNKTGSTCEFGVNDGTSSTTTMWNKTTSNDNNARLNGSNVAGNFPTADLTNIGTNHLNLRDIGGGDSELEIYADGVLYGNQSITPNTVPTGRNLFALARNNQGTADIPDTGQLSWLIIGGDLSAEAADIHDILDTYMTAIGKNV